ncbi:MAG TPA: NlpC/P60 family protein [Microlunatus sp.]
MPSAGRRAITVIAALSSAAALFATAGIPSAEAASSSGVATTTVHIRTGASTSAAVVGRLIRGQKITITGAAAGDWVKVRFRSGTAYMDEEYLDRSGARPGAPKSLPSAGIRIATAELNIRTGANGRSRVVGELAEGSAITLTGRYGSGYAEFRHHGSLRWVFAAYLAEPVGTSGSPSPVITPIATPIVQPAPVSGSTRGEIALAFGRAQLGEPYVYGATGPDRWDCSGLTQAAWRAAGVSIPRTTYTQVKVGQRVARSDLRLGDLVFFYGSRPSHVGLYAGNGMVLNAPRPGKTVSYSKISSMPYAGAVRPG